jgi:hypothetical protein
VVPPPAASSDPPSRAPRSEDDDWIRPTVAAPDYLLARLDERMRRLEEPATKQDGCELYAQGVHAPSSGCLTPAVSRAGRNARPPVSRSATRPASAATAC